MHASRLLYIAYASDHDTACCLLHGRTYSIQCIDKIRCNCTSNPCKSCPGTHTALQAPMCSHNCSAFCLVLISDVCRQYLSLYYLGIIRATATPLETMQTSEVLQAKVALYKLILCVYCLRANCSMNISTLHVKMTPSEEHFN